MSVKKGQRNWKILLTESLPVPSSAGAAQGIMEIGSTGQFEEQTDIRQSLFIIRYGVCQTAVCGRFPTNPCSGS